MKKIWLIAFVFNCTFIWAQDFSAGFKLSLPCFQTAYFQNSKTANWAVNFSNKNISFYAGNLLFSGSISGLNSPVISSSVSPFSSGISKVLPLSAAFPGTTSFTKNTSVFSNIDFLIQNFSNSIGILYIPSSSLNKNTFYINVNSKYKFKTKAAFNINLSTGLFPFNEKNLTSWFSKDYFYPQGNHICSSINTSFTSQGFSTFFQFNCYETPFSTFSCTFKNENKVKIKHAVFTVSQSYVPQNAVLTSSGRQLNKSFLVKTAFQYNFITGITKPNFLTTGLCLYSDVTPQKQDKQFKTAAGLKLTNQDYDISFTTTISANYEDFLSCKTNKHLIQKFSKIDIALKSSFFTKVIKPSLNLSFTLEPESSSNSFIYTEKINAAFSFADTAYLYNSNTITLKQKTGSKNQIDFTTGLSSKISFNYISCSFKIEYSISTDN